MLAFWQSDSCRLTLGSSLMMNSAEAKILHLFSSLLYDAFTNAILHNPYKNDQRVIVPFFHMRKIRCCLKDFPEGHRSSDSTSVVFHSFTHMLVR